MDTYIELSGFESVARMLETQATRTPESTAFTFGEKTISFDAVRNSSARVAHALRNLGVDPQERVAVLGKTSIEFIEILFGLSRINAVAVSVNWRLAEGEILDILRDAGTRVLLVSAEFSALARQALSSGLDMTVVVWGGGDADRVGLDYDAWVADQPTTFDDVPCLHDDTVVQLYTSGTTGHPKGVMSSSDGLMRSLQLLSGYTRMTPDAVSLSTLPLFHIGGLAWLFAGVYGGSETVVLADSDVTRILEAVDRHAITTMFAVPTVIQRMTESPLLSQLDLSSVQTLYYGSGPITVPVLKRAIDLFHCDFLQGFGMTEIPLMTLLTPEDHLLRPELLRSCGRVVQDTELRLVDPETGADVATGQVGELWVRSPRLLKGYWKNGRDATDETLEPDGWFRTGDAGRVDEDGYYFLEDRLKDMIVTGGENVYSAEVENVLMAHPAILECAVIGVYSESWGETVKALVVPAPGEHVDQGEVIAFCRQRLAHFKCPTTVDVVDGLPRNTTGKVLKHELRARYSRAIQETR